MKGPRVETTEPEAPLPATAERQIPTEPTALAGSPVVAVAASSPPVAPTVPPGASLLITESAAADGRRGSDEQRLTILEATRPIANALYWLFGIFLEPKPPHKPSITRVSWWLVILSGLGMFFQEITHRFGAHAPSNAAWQGWAIAFTVCGTAVGFPKAIDFWKNGGAAAIGTIGQAVRDKLPSKEPSKHDDERHDA